VPSFARKPLFLFLLLGACMPSAFPQQPQYGSPGEMDAVIRLCGNPRGISKGISPVTNTLQRNLMYSDTLILHFQPVKGGWGFTTGWDGHLPVTRQQLEARMPCFRQAMTEAAAAPAPKSNVDPTIADQTAAPAFNNANFGIPHLYLILVLVGIVLLFVLIPTAKQRRRRRLELEERNYRKPDVHPNKPSQKHIDPDLYQ